MIGFLYDLRPDEKVVFEAGVSRAKLLLKWISAPSFIILPSLFVIIVRVFRLIQQRIFLKHLLDEVDVIPEAITEGASIITRVLTGLGIGALSILLFAWIIFCWITTSREKQAFLVFTDSRVVGQSTNQRFEYQFEDVVDVFAEESLLGKLFHYGNVTIHAKKSSVTIKGIQSPKVLQEIFRQQNME